MIDNFKLPLMNNNITKSDINAVIDFLSQPEIPILTQSKKVKQFEEEWAKWLGVKYSVFVNSGSSANQLTMLILKELYGGGEIIVPPLTWVSDISSVIQNGFTPVFCDITLKNLALDFNEIKKKTTDKTKAIFLTHVLGYNGITQELLDFCKEKHIHLIEDVCESHGATFNGKKCGSFGLISNFSFYYAHHLTSIEGGMICTDDERIYQYARMFRSHGMVRECTNEAIKEEFKTKHSDLNLDFIFSAPAYNMRSTEINAVMALNQLGRLDTNNKIRKENLDIFLDTLDKTKYFVEFERDGNSNYAFTLLLRTPDFEMRDKVEAELKNNNIEFRRGMSGGGNQLRQPYLKRIFGYEYDNYPIVDFVHNFGWYIGNFPELEKYKIETLVKILNDIKIENEVYDPMGSWRPIKCFVDFIRGTLNEGGTVLEIGCFTGDTTIHYAPIVKQRNGKVFLIGWFKGNIQAMHGMYHAYERLGNISTRSILEKKLKYADVFDIVTIIEESSATAYTRLSDYNIKFDVIFIDADHSYNAVISDIKNYISYCKPSGVICGHDYNQIEVKLAVNKYFSDIGLPVYTINDPDGQRQPVWMVHMK